MEKKGWVHSLESFGSVDGPGVRYLIFLSGCRMRCAYCHNPDTWQEAGGQAYTARELLDKALRYRSYWGQEGGITVSGGEPLLQMDFLLELFTLAKEQGIHTCIDTAGQPFTYAEPYFSTWKKLMEVTDLVLLDIKHIDPEAHRVLTGHGVDSIQAMANELAARGIPVWIRHVLVPGVNDAPGTLARLRRYLDGLSNIQRVEVLPYHSLGVHKWRALGLPYRLEGVKAPTEESLRQAIEILRAEPRG